MKKYMNNRYRQVAAVMLAGMLTSGSAWGQTRIGGSVYGGGNQADTGGTTVNLTGGTVVNDVYGGGNKANVDGATYVSLTGGTVNHDVYGGGRGTLDVTDDEGTVVTAGTAATVGSATVELNPGVADDTQGCIVLGSVFGCNNLNGTPLGSVLVHIYATQRNGATRITNVPSIDGAPAVEDAKVFATRLSDGSYDLSTFDVKSVYGGGNLAAYKPTNSLLSDNETNHAAIEAARVEVIIDGCDRTSVGQVYGGGNAASAPATYVTVNGTFEIGDVFGGGNGKDDISLDGGLTYIPNPGANVGFHAYAADAADATTTSDRISHYGYGSGIAQVDIRGGMIHTVYGGSNTKGNVRRTAVARLDEAGICEFNVGECYGGGNEAEMDGDIVLDIRCIPGMNTLYGGARNADVNGDVTLNVTCGTYSQIFGGNNMGGCLRGAITLNVEETGCRPVIIGELYGGGNMAAYSVFGYNALGKPMLTGDSPLYDHPQVNLKSFTSIGSVYGGGYGSGATIVGDTYVNVNVVMDGDTDAQTRQDAEGNYYSDFAGDVVTIDQGKATQHDVARPTHARGELGAIGDVFGAGNAAELVGNSHVRIGTEKTVNYVTNDDVEKTVTGADIRGNVYGGGNQADVTGATDVVIGTE